MIVHILALTLGLIGAGYIFIGTAGGYWQVLIGLAISGLGLGLMMPNLSVWLTTTVTAAQRGRAVGGLNAFLFLGQFLSPIISQPIISQVGFSSTYTLAGAVAVLLLASAFFLASNRIMRLTSNRLAQPAEAKPLAT